MFVSHSLRCFPSFPSSLLWTSRFLAVQNKVADHNGDEILIDDFNFGRGSIDTTTTIPTWEDSLRGIITLYNTVSSSFKISGQNGLVFGWFFAFFRFPMFRIELMFKRRVRIAYVWFLALLIRKSCQLKSQPHKLVCSFRRPNFVDCSTNNILLWKIFLLLLVLSWLRTFPLPPQNRG